MTPFAVLDEDGFVTADFVKHAQPVGRDEVAQHFHLLLQVVVGHRGQQGAQFGRQVGAVQWRIQTPRIEQLVEQRLVVLLV